MIRCDERFKEVLKENYGSSILLNSFQKFLVVRKRRMKVDYLNWKCIYRTGEVYYKWMNKWFILFVIMLSCDSSMLHLTLSSGYLNFPKAHTSVVYTLCRLKFGRHISILQLIFVRYLYSVISCLALAIIILNILEYILICLVADILLSRQRFVL